MGGPSEDMGALGAFLSSPFLARRALYGVFWNGKPAPRKRPKRLFNLIDLPPVLGSPPENYKQVRECEGVSD